MITPSSSSTRLDFDSSWGHRRDVAGYAAGLELFDRRLPELMELVGEMTF